MAEDILLSLTYVRRLIHFGMTARPVVAGQAMAAARAGRLARVGHPKGGQLGTDLGRDRLAATLAGHGVQPVRQVSIDGTWFALRFRPAKQ